MGSSQEVLLSLKERKEQQEDSIAKVQDFIAFLKEMPNITDWDLSLGLQDGFSLEVRNQSIEECEQSETAEFSMRIYLGDRSGSAICLGLQKGDWREAARRAFYIAKMSQIDSFSRLPERKYFEAPLKKISLESQEILSPHDLLSHAQQGEDWALKGIEPGVLQSNGSSVSAQYSFLLRANSRGLWAQIPSTFYSHSIALVSHGPDGSESDWAGQNRRQWRDLKSPQELATLAQRRALAQRVRHTVRSGDYPIIFSHRCASSLIQHILEGLSGRAQYLKSTFLLGSVGQKILPSWVTLEDNPYWDFGPGSVPIDNDGLPTRPQILIKEGIVQKYLLSHYSALRLGLEPNGLGSGLCNPIMTTNAQNLDEILALYPKCLVVDSLSGTGVSISQGTYSRGVEGAYYEKGERLFALKETTIATTLLPFYLSLQAHAPTYEPGSSWRVGCLGFPSIRVSCD